MGMILIKMKDMLIYCLFEEVESVDECGEDLFDVDD